jgi:SAM-dependent methyltransferase
MRRLWIALTLAGTAAGLAATAFWLSYGDAAAFSGVGLPTVLAHLTPVVALTSLNLSVRWLRWHFLTRRFIRTLATRASLKLYLGTLPAFATPLYLGELVRTAIAARRAPEARAAVFYVWAAERLADAAALGLFLLLAQTRWAALLVLGAVGAAGLALLRARLDRRVVSVLSRPRVLGALLASSVAAWLLPVAALWLLLRQLAAPLSFAQSAEIFSLATFLGGISLLPLGSGVTGSSMILELGSLGVETDIAVAAVAVFRAGTGWYALGLGLLAFAVWRRDVVSMARAAAPREHFHQLAPDYGAQIPAHVRERVVGRKVAAMLSRLPPAGGARISGLEIGCGHGWYSAELARRGYAMTACDVAPGQAEEARKFLERQGLCVQVDVADAQALPYPDACFDFAFGVNVLHHVSGARGRSRALSEVLRVLKPGGCFFLHEINTENPLFALYMGYVFPILRDIDDGTEEWIRPSALPRVEGARWDPRVAYLTFLPDFTPRGVLRRLAGLERALERSSVRHWSAHYMARLVKRPEAGWPPS